MINISDGVSLHKKVLHRLKFAILPNTQLHHVHVYQYVTYL